MGVHTGVMEISIKHKSRANDIKAACYAQADVGFFRSANVLDGDWQG